jgi:hypothetical protein
MGNAPGAAGGGAGGAAGGGSSHNPSSFKPGGRGKDVESHIAQSLRYKNDVKKLYMTEDEIKKKVTWMAHFRLSLSLSQKNTLFMLIAIHTGELTAVLLGLLSVWSLCRVDMFAVFAYVWGQAAEEAPQHCREDCLRIRIQSLLGVSDP